MQRYIIYSERDIHDGYHVRENWEIFILVSLNIGQHNALEIFAVKTSISEISKELLNDIFSKLDRRSTIKKFTDRAERLILGELQVDDISTKLTAENTKKYIPIR